MPTFRDLGVTVDKNGVKKKTHISPDEIQKGIAPAKKEEPKTNVVHGSTALLVDNTNMIAKLNDILHLVEDVAYDNQMRLTDPENPGVHYYPINHVVILYSDEDRSYQVGNLVFYDTSVQEFRKTLESNPHAYEEGIKTSTGQGIAKNFLELFAEKIMDMIDQLDNIAAAHGIDSASYFNMIIDEIHELEQDDASAEREEHQSQEIVPDPVQDIHPHYPINPQGDEADNGEEVSSDEEELVEEAQGDLVFQPDSFDYDSIPDLEEDDPDTVTPPNSNLMAYARDIDQKVPDSAVEQLLEKARLGRKDRSIQREYNG